MDAVLKERFLAALNEELIPALGCTEPIAIAYASAKARDILGQFPEHIELSLSGNIIKNVKSVTVPHSNGLCGMDVAAVLGLVGGDAARELEVLEGITPEQIETCRTLLKNGIFTCKLKEDVSNLYIEATVRAGAHSATVIIANHHTDIVHIEKDGKVLFHTAPTLKNNQRDWSGWSVAHILEFANEVEIEDVGRLLDQQLTLNTAISEAGLHQTYGANVGRSLLDTFGDHISVRARARAAAASDARMNGCPLPVVINSGSGNQGITVSLPLVEYAKEWNSSHEMLLRALTVSNLVSIYIKHYIGSLSAFCGAVTAACGAGAGITYLYGGSYEQIANCITNTLGNVSGIVCDGAKSSCAAKIASAVDAAILGFQMSIKGNVFQFGEGIVMGDLEQTIRNIGQLGRVGMKRTDVEILNLMIGSVCP